MELSRHDYILKCIVDYFIKTAMPVGSSTLIEKYNLPYSSATIRNEMAVLESQGLIEKTHTSSGRIPSSKGYHYYINHLRTTSIDDDIKEKLALIINERSKSVEDVIKESCEMISDLTNLASVVLGPSAYEESLLSIQIVPLSDNSASAIFITDKGYVENKTFVLGNKISLNNVKKCVEMLNDRLKGTKISQLIPKMEAMKPLISNYVQQNDVIYRAFMEAFVKFASERVSLFGTENLLDLPEFDDDTEKLKQIIRFIESKERVKKVASSDEDMTISIGVENEETAGVKDVTLISKKIPLGELGKGTLALVGPTRMDYDLVVNVLDYLADELDKMFNLERKSDDEK